jgi:hypothetical protein
MLVAGLSHWLKIELLSDLPCSAVPGAPPQPSPVRALWKSPDGSKSVAVLVKESSAIKPTFLQVCLLTLVALVERAPMQWV